eukprot:scaffold605868_cov17-Prasinocladus_malaysianus.AAC.1
MHVYGRMARSLSLGSMQKNRRRGMNNAASMMVAGSPGCEASLAVVVQGRMNAGSVPVSVRRPRYGSRCTRSLAQMAVVR